MLVKYSNTGVAKLCLHLQYMCVFMEALLIYSTSSLPWATASEHQKSNQEGGKTQQVPFNNGPNESGI